ncbi:MAG: PrpF domain-containing protein [Rhizonema sp. PD37]|nr:PrpF domain-containing protein [Rhizonema sp. PD37]
MTDLTSEQATLRCVIMRGGTSKGLYFHEHDLPNPGPKRDKLLQRVMGSPDVLQIDGLGGSRPITSKVAIISKSQRDDADINYTFAQVEIERNLVVYTGNCGNISSGVGPFAIDEGLVNVQEENTRVRIYNTNTERIIIADVPVKNGKAKVEGSFAVPGVPGTGAEIAMNWANTVGAKTGHLLPTGKPSDEITLEDGKSINATLCDAANPCVCVLASDFGIDGSELVDEIDGNTQLIDRVREVRGKAGVLFGFCKDWQRVDDESPGLPMVGLVSPSKDYKTLSGTEIAEKDMDLRVRLIFMNRLHESIAGTASVCLAVASCVKDSVVQKIVSRTGDVLRIGHPSGTTPTKVKAHPINEAPFVKFEYLGFSRTARRLMDCTAYYPQSALENVDEHVNREDTDSLPAVIHE